MKYYFKENFRFFLADGALYDSDNVPVYTYQNRTVLLPEVELYRGNERVGMIATDLTFMLRRYQLYMFGQHIGTLQQRFRWFTHKLELPELGWTIEGDFLAMTYRILDERGDVLATVDQEMFRMTRRYYVNIIDESHELELVLLVTAINLYDKQISAHASSSYHHHNR